MRTPRIFIILIFSSMLLFILSGMGISYIFMNLPGYISGIELFFTHCFSLALLPLTILPMLRFSLPCIVAALLISGFFRAVYKSLQKIKRNRQILKSFHEIDLEKSVRLKRIITELKFLNRVCLFESDNLLYAFTSGFIRPGIYLSTGLVTNLSDRELKAVILHEKYHIERKDLLKLFFITFLEDWLFFLPVYQWLSRVYYERMEKVTDHKVVSFLGEPISFAKTLLKIVKLNKAKLLPDAGLSIVGHYSLEKRIKYLINKTGKISIPPKRIVYRNFLIGILVFGPFFYRVFLTSEEIFRKYKDSIYEICGKHDEKLRGHHQMNEEQHHLDGIFDD